MKISYAPLLILCLGLGACASQVPVATTYPVSYQRKMQAAEHWDILAADVANRLHDALLAGPVRASGRQCKSAIALHVQPPQYNSEFGIAFHNLLITHLLEQGFLVSESPSDGCYEVTYGIQVVTHNDRGFIRPMPGLFTALTGSVLVLRATGDNNPATAAMLGAVGLDVASGFLTDNPNSEIIVTTSVMSGARYLTRLRDIYYISDNNVQQYIAQAPAPPPPVTTRIMDMVGCTSGIQCQ